MIETEVLIVGLGPTGAVLAAILAQHGVSSVVVERNLEVYRLPRAAHFDGEIMRVFQQIGIAEEIAPHTRPLSLYEFRSARGDVLMRFAQGDGPGSQGWHVSFMFHQPAVEDAIRAKLATDRRVKLLLGWQLESFSQGDRAITASVRSRADDMQRVSARFLVGCDGGASLTRKLAGIELFDFGFDEPWLVIDTVVKDESNLPAWGVQLCDPKRPTSIMPMAPGRRRWEFMLRPDERAEDMLDDAAVARLLSPWSGKTRIDVIRKAVYRFHGLVARRWRIGNVILAGDAAHQMPPFLGQGMCSGIRDAANLAWKLAAVLKDGAPTTLLDTYQAEREQHVRAIIETAIAMGRIVCTTDETAAAKRDADFIAAGMKGSQAAPPLSLPGLEAGCLHPSPRAGELFPQPDSPAGRFDDLVGHGFVLVAQRGQPRGRANIRLVAVEDFPSLAPWLDSAGSEAVLVRPDRYVFGTGDAETLLQAFEQQGLCPPVMHVS